MRLYRKESALTALAATALATAGLATSFIGGCSPDQAEGVTPAPQPAGPPGVASFSWTRPSEEYILANTIGPDRRRSGRSGSGSHLYRLVIISLSRPQLIVSGYVRQRIRYDGARCSRGIGYLPDMWRLHIAGNTRCGINFPQYIDPIIVIIHRNTHASDKACRCRHPTGQIHGHPVGKAGAVIIGNRDAGMANAQKQAIPHIYQIGRITIGICPGIGRNGCCWHRQ